MREHYLALSSGAQGEAPTIEQTRRMYDEWLTAHAPVPDDLVQATVEYGGVRSLVLTMPSTSTDRTVLYLHGGGYLIGRPEGYAAIGAAISAQGDAQVVMPDYRLGPEHAHPAALDDVHAVYRAVAAERGPGNIVLCGDSAGGGLVLALLLAIRDAGETLPAGAVAMSPWADLTLSGDSMTANADLDPAISGAALQGMAAAYLQGQDPEQPTASPLFGDLTGLPPLLVIAGDHEALRDDATRFAERARAAGVDVTLDIVEEMFHAFPITPDAFPEAREACERIGAFVFQHSA